MPNKCESCKHYRPDNNRCKAWPVRNLGGDYVSVDLTTARDICDRESNGIFVYFEPKTPTSGAAFEAETRPVGSVFSPHGESRSEFERDRMGQTGYDNAKAMKAAA